MEYKNKTKSWIFEKIKNDTSLSGLRKKKRGDPNKIRNKRENIAIDAIEI